MAAENDWMMTLGIVTLLILLAGGVFALLYKRASHDRAYVRTGHGGEVIALNTGLFVLPILHHVSPVNLKTVHLEIKLEDDQAVLTKDYLKVNLTLGFYLHIIPEKETIAHAARTLGKLTLQPELLQEHFSSHLIYAIRNIAAEMTIDEIQQQQAQFIEKIQAALHNELLKNSINLESVSLKQLSQTNKAFFKEDNVFDAEGLTKLSEAIETEKKSRKEAELKYQLHNKQKELDMEKLQVEMENKKNKLRFDHEREIKLIEAEKSLALAQDNIKKRHAKKQAQILARQQLQLLKQESEIKLNIKSREQLLAKIETDKIKAQAVKAKEQVKSARKLEKADNQVNIKLLEVSRKSQIETAQITEIAIAKKKASIEAAEAIRIKAKAEADKLNILETSKMEAEKLMEESFKNRCRNEADGLQALIETFNSLTKGDLPQEIFPDLIAFFTNKRKSSQSRLYTSKLQSILDEARQSLATEALDSLNDESKKENMDG